MPTVRARGRDDARRRHRHAARVRRDPARRRRLAGRAGPRLAVGAADPDPAGVPAVRQPAADQGVRRRAEPAARRGRASTSSWSGRTSRASTARSAAGSTAASPTRWRSRSRCSPGSGSAGSRTIAFELGADPARVRHVGDEVERHRAHAAVLGRGGRRTGGAATRTCGWTASTSTRWRRSSSCSRSASTWWSGRTCSATSCPTSRPRWRGSIGIAPSANLDPTKQYPSMFEPVHGSAPDIAGQGVANPVGAVWSAAMMLDHLGHPAAAADVLAAMEATLAEPDTRTGDLGGTASTAEVRPRHWSRSWVEGRGATRSVCAGHGRGERLRRPFVEPRQPPCDVPPDLSPAGG